MPVLLLALVAGIGGCGGARPITAAAPDSRVAGEVAYRLALLPWVDEAGRPEVAVLVARVLEATLVGSGCFQVVGEGDVRTYLRRRRLLPTAVLDGDTLRDAARSLNVDALVVGKLLAAGSDARPGDGEVPHLAVQLQWVAATGGTRLRTFHACRGDDYRRAFHFGVVRTLTGLAEHLCDEIVADWMRKGLGRCGSS